MYSIRENYVVVYIIYVCTCTYTYVHTLITGNAIRSLSVKESEVKAYIKCWRAVHGVCAYVCCLKIKCLWIKMGDPTW